MDHIRSSPGPQGGRRAALAALCCALAYAPALAAEPNPSDPLAFLQEETVSVTTKNPQSERRAPGVVTVITREEIVNSGARDLIDVLQQVPGFFFGQDTQGMVGIGFRGIWGHEGKISLIIDGQTMNELDYGTLQFGNHYPIDDIERIEIIRGPGSVVYGGFAELAVINVVTRSAQSLHGGAASWSYGTMDRAVGHDDVSLDLGGYAPGVKGLSGTLSGWYGQGNRSDGTYQDFSGRQVSLSGNNTLDPRFVNASLQYQGLSLRVIFDGYRTGTIDGFGQVIPRDTQTFPAQYAEAKYAFKPVEGLTLTPQFNYERQQPWLITNTNSNLYADRIEEMFTGTLTASYDALQDLNLLGGVSGYEELARLAGVTQPIIPQGPGLQRYFEDNKSARGCPGSS